MKRFAACLSAGGMVVALLTAPLFHLHERDDARALASMVHAHFPEAAGSHHHEDELEDRHAHETARWIQVFTFDESQPGFDLAVVFSETFGLPRLETREGTMVLPVPCSHGPPGVRSSVPRSPPTA